MENVKHTFNILGQTIDFSWDTDQNANILLLEYKTSLTGEALAFIDVICKLFHARSVNSLLEVNFREIESYLRDENHIVCFEKAPESFTPVIALCEELYWAMIMPTPKDSVSEEATYIEKIQAITKYLDESWNESSLVKIHNFEVTFIALEEELVILEFKKSTEETTKLLLCEKLIPIFSSILCRKSIKVVAEV